MTRMQFAFQGGGAKLGSLLAAAEAVFAQQTALNFTISRVSGTSAGAIAACILATGVDPATFRQRLISLAKSQIDEICKDYSYPMLGYHLWNGNPLYNTTAYQRFLADLFDLGTRKWVYLEDLSPDIEIFIHAVDIRTREPKIYKKSERATIVDALFDSSALPFIFKTYSDQTGIFDGGLVNNFPSAALLAEESKFGYVAGFSFEPQPVQFQFAGLKDFISALVSTMMDNATHQSLAKLPVGDVHYIKTSTSTLDFRAALKNDLEGSNYGQYVTEVNRFLSDFLARKRMRGLTVSPEELAKRMMELHEVFRKKQKLRVKKIVLTLKSNSLKVRNPANPASVDEFFLTHELIAEDPLYTFGFRVTVDEKVFDPGDIKPMVIDEEGKSIGVTTLPITPNVFGGQVPENNVILFFHRPLEAGKKYQISCSGKAEEVLYDLLSTKRWDSVTYIVRNVDRAEEVDLIAYIPEDIPKPDLSQITGPLPEGVVWKKGVELERGDLAPIWGRHPEFYPIGWRGRDLNRGDALGFRAYNTAP